VIIVYIKSIRGESDAVLIIV